MDTPTALRHSVNSRASDTSQPSGWPAGCHAPRALGVARSATDGSVSLISAKRGRSTDGLGQDSDMPVCMHNTVGIYPHRSEVIESNDASSQRSASHDVRPDPQIGSATN